MHCVILLGSTSLHMTVLKAPPNIQETLPMLPLGFRFGIRRDICQSKSLIFSTEVLQFNGTWLSFLTSNFYIRKTKFHSADVVEKFHKIV